MPPLHTQPARGDPARVLPPQVRASRARCSGLGRLLTCCRRRMGAETLICWHRFLAQKSRRSFSNKRQDAASVSPVNLKRSA